MKKHYFNVIAALALLCGVFAFTGCADYESDINSINDRLDALETGQLPSLEEQLQNMNDAISNANELIDILNGNVGDLQDADESLRQQIDLINENIETVENNIVEINTRITEQENLLNGRIDDAVAQITDVEDELLAAIDALRTELENAINSGNVDVAESISRINDKIAELTNQVNNLVTVIQAGDNDNRVRIDELADQIKNDKAELQSLISSGDAANLEKINELSQRITDNTNTLTNAITTTNLRIDSLKSDLAATETELRNEFNLKFDNVGAKFEEIDGVIADFRSEFETVATEIKDINGKIDALNSELKEQIEALASLTENVTALEAAVDALKKLHAQDIKDLQASVDSIKDNYLTVDEAELTYEKIFGDITALQNRMGAVETGLKALEDLNIAERLKDLEANCENLENVVIPGLNEKITAAQTAADEAMDYAEEVNDRLLEVAGDLKTLKEALEAYANNLEDRLDQFETMDSTLDAKIDEMTKGLQEEFNGKFDELSASVLAQITGLQQNMDNLGKELRGLISDLEERKLNKTEFEEYMANLGKQLEETEGQLREDMAESLNILREKLDAELKAINDRLDTIDERLETLEDTVASLEDDFGNLRDDVEDWQESNNLTIDELINRIQSLVFVPEYSDGMATSYAYTVAGQDVSETQNVIATFQVKPDNLAADIVEAAKAGNVTISAVPVLTRAANESTDISGENIKVELGEFPGRVEVEALVPRDMENFYIALTVSDKDKPEGSHVTSEYVNVAKKVTPLDGHYALINAEGVDYDYTKKEVGQYQRQWTDAPAEVTFYEGYNLMFNLDGEYITIEEAEDALYLPDGSLELRHSFSVLNPERGIKVVEDEEKGYGAIASMTTDNTASHVGEKINVDNVFFYANVLNYKVENLCGVTTYEIIPVTYELNIELNERTWPEGIVNWTYELAKAHKIIYNGTQEPLNLDQMSVTNWDEYKDQEGAFKYIDELLKDGTPSFEEVLRTVDGGQAEDLTDEFNAHPEDAATGYVAIMDQAFVEPVVNVTIDNYQFEKGKTVTYNIRKVYEDSKGHSRVIFNLEYTLGAMPVDRTFNLAEEIGREYLEIPFQATSFVEIMLGEENASLGADYAYYSSITPMQWAYPEDGGYFEDFEAFKQSLYDNTQYGGERNYTVYTEKKNETTGRWEMHPNDRGDVDPDNFNLMTDYWTFLSILNEPAAAKEESIRVSSANIDKIGDEFRFTAEIETWYGVNYTFTTEAVIDDPTYSLVFNTANVESIDAESGMVYLRAKVDNSDAKYKIDVIDFSNYFNVQGASATSEKLAVQFYPVTKYDPANGYTNVPMPGAWVVNVNNANGNLASSALDWNSGYTALDYEVEAVLYVYGHNDQKIEVDRKTLTLVANDPIREMFADEEVSLTRPVGKDLVIKPWQYLNIVGIIEDSGNADLSKLVTDNLLEVEDGGEDIGNGEVEYWQLSGANGALKPYGGELSFDFANIILKDEAGNDIQNKMYEYDAANGTVTFSDDFGTYVTELIMTIPAKLTYTLDGAGKWSKTGDVVIRINLER